MKGRDLQNGLTISFEEAAFGIKKQIRINKYVECEACQGSGAAAGSAKVTCPKCGGTGETRTTQKTPFGQFQSVTACDRCEGTGKIIETPCVECGGTGKVRKDVTMSVDIPAGVDNDSVISIKGQGEPGINGGPFGDLYIAITVRPHKLFKRKGQDLWLEIPVSFAQAALGDELAVPTLSEKVSYTIPPGTQPETIFRLKGKGIRSLRGNKMGDLYVKVILEVPTKLNSKQKKLIEELGETLTNDSYNKRRTFAETMKELFS